MPPEFANKGDYLKWLEEQFGAYRNAEDPLETYLQIAIQKNISPVDAIHYWVATNGKNAFYFKLGLRSQRQLLGLLTSSPDYFEKHAKDFLKYLEWLSKTV